MQSTYMFHAILALLSLSVSVAIQDGSMQLEGFRKEAEASAKLVGELEEKVEHIFDEKPTQHGKADREIKQHGTKEHAIPAGRQQMYFRPVSVTLHCVMALTIVGLLVYTSLSVSRNVDELSAKFRPSTATQSLTICSRVSSFAPMLCMLCVACRMFVLATTEGQGEPPHWVKMCMYITVAGVGIQMLIVLVLPWVTKKQAEEDATYDMTVGKKAAWSDENFWRKDVEHGEFGTQSLQDAVGEQNDVHPNLSTIQLREESKSLAKPFWFVQMVSMMCIYGGVTGVIVGIATFPGQSTKVSAAVWCTIILSILYFGVCFFLWVTRATGASQSRTNACLAMSTTTRKTPMFAVLFLASRMRALQLDPPNGMPSLWMQNCFYAITVLVYLEALVAYSVGSNGEKTKGYYGVYLFKSPMKAMHIAHHGFAILSYAVLIPLCIGVWKMEDASGARAPLSTTMGCTLAFVGAYFGIMLAQDVVLFVEQYDGMELTVLRDTVISAGISLGLAPLLCILFVATRMRALQITQQVGAPPGWAQDCMIIAVFATFVQSVCCLLMPIFIGAACQVDEDGNADYDLKPMVGAYAVSMVKYMALLALHGSVITICVAVFVMTPDTAHSGGRFINNRKEVFKLVAITLGVFCIALLLSSAKVVGLAIKFAIESADEALLGVNVTVEKVALNLFKGYVNVRKLKVFQPENELVYTKNRLGKIVGAPTGKKCEWKEDYLAKVDLLLIKINLWRLATSMGKEFDLENLSVVGVHVNIEKPTADMKVDDANIQYITNHLGALGLIPEADPDLTIRITTKPEKEIKEALFGDNLNKNDKTDTLDYQVIVGKIAFGDIGAGVRIRGVKLLGEISFQPKIGLIEFDDVERQVFGGRTDLKPGEIVACIIQAVASQIFKTAKGEIPQQMAKAAADAAMAAKDGMKSRVTNAMRKVPLACK